MTSIVLPEKGNQIVETLKILYGELSEYERAYAALGGATGAMLGGWVGSSAAAANLHQGTAVVAQGTTTVAQGTTTVAQGTTTVAQGTTTVAQGITTVAQQAGVIGSSLVISLTWITSGVVGGFLVGIGIANLLEARERKKAMKAIESKMEKQVQEILKYQDELLLVFQEHSPHNYGRLKMLITSYKCGMISKENFIKQSEKIVVGL